MTSRYTHLQPEERLTLASLTQQGCSQRSITRILGRSPSTICRELARNGTATNGYAFKPAQAACQCIDPAVFAQVRPLMQMLERAFSSSAPGGDADGYRS